MKYLICLLFFVLVYALAPAQEASANDQLHSVALQVGQVWPAGKIGEDVEGNIGYGLEYEYTASEVFSLFATGIHSEHTDNKLNLTTTSLGIKTNLVYYDKLTPYAFLGMGLYFVDKKVGTANEIAHATSFGLNMGVGADLDLSDHFYAGMLFDLHNMFTKTVTLPISGRTELSGRWSGLFLRAGVRF